MDNVNLIAVGDIYLKVHDNQDPFEHVHSLFKQKDILFGNLETPLTIKGQKNSKAVVLCADPKNVEYLKNAEFDVLNLANNHILDLGAHMGRLKEKTIREDIEDIVNFFNFIVVSLHGGIGNVFYPSPKKIRLAHKLIDHGVNLILGHHSHVVQGIDEYNNGLIIYLGNFQFNLAISKSKHNRSFILNVEIINREIVGTGLTNYIMLLIRYRTDMTSSGESCVCGKIIKS